MSERNEVPGEPDETLQDWPPPELTGDDSGPHTIRSHRVVASRPPRGRWVLLVVAVLLLGGGGMAAYRVIGAPPAEPTAVPRQTYTRTPAGIGDPASPPLAPSPTEEPSPTPTASSSATPRATSGRPSATTTTTTRVASAPTQTTTGTTAAAPTTTTTEPFVPITLEAERGVLLGTASPMACVLCSGGSRVAYIDTASAVILSTTLSHSGTRTIRVTYETEGARELKIMLNGVLVDVRWVNGTSWDEPRTFQFSVSIPAGPVELRFYNEVNPAPDIDAVTIS